MLSRPVISIILITYNMTRETPRTLQSLSPAYQQGIQADEYEVIVVENGSDQRLDEAQVRSAGPYVEYHYLKDPPPSPASAINFGVRHSHGDILCIMIDGACLVTPGVLRFARIAFRSFGNPVVMTRYFFLGPGEQGITMRKRV